MRMKRLRTLAAWILAAGAVPAQEERKPPPPLATAFSLADRAYQTVAWSAPGPALVAGAEGLLRVRDLRPRAAADRLLPADGPVEQLFFDAATNLLVARTNAWQPRLWDTRSWKPVRFVLEDLDAAGLAVRASWPSEDSSAPLVLANPSRGTLLWRIGRRRGNARPILQIDLRDWAGAAFGKVTAAAWAEAALLVGNEEGRVHYLPEMRSLLAPTDDGPVILGRVVGGPLEQLRILNLHRGAVSFIAARNTKLVTAAADGKVRLWSLEGLPEKRPPRRPIDLDPEWEIDGHAADLSPDGQFLAVADAEGVGVYHASSGVAIAWNPVRPLKGKAVRLRFSPDGRLLAAIVCRCRDCAAGDARPGLRGRDHAGEVVVWK